MLDRVALQIEKEQMIKRRVKGAMVYPTIVLIFATLTLNGMLLFLVPIFTKIFAQLGGQLPTLTQYVVKVSDLLRGAWFVIFPGFGLVDLRRHPLQADRARAPALGPHTDPPAAADRADRPQDHDRPLLADDVDPRRRRRRHHQGARDHRPDLGQLGLRRGARSRRRQRVHEGSPISQPLIENPVFPPMVSQMIKVGEETGELDKMLSKIADFYEDEVDAAIATLSSIVEPVMMIAVGAGRRRDRDLDVPADVQDAQARALTTTGQDTDGRTERRRRRRTPDDDDERTTTTLALGRFNIRVDEGRVT